ncbi:hypothetical protein A9K55_008948 [Cordyceps militaris]|uniref:Uncharacterized protein n=1 Tax=Cordyceps militaris TaxID=73501 RepID=A0A2H4SGE6_CORMI|nr:hypothetical protein A9K55_008948 [Cordyceps militaris]
MHFLPVLLLAMLGSAQASQALVPVCLCENLKTCSGKQSQCTKNGEGWECCAPGQRYLNGACRDPSYVPCSDGKTICSGDTPQCTINADIFKQGERICCARGQQANSGKCYPPTARLVACYANGPCDLDKEEYCAWSTTGGYSRCCKRDQYINNSYECQAKPAK